MHLLFTIIVTFFAGMGAGLGTGFAGMSAAAVISPILITFLGIDPRHCIIIRCTGQRRFCLYLRQEQESGYQKRPDHDGYCPDLHCCGQLYIQPGSIRNHGQFLRLYDFPVGYQIHCETGYDYQGSDAGRIR